MTDGLREIFHLHAESNRQPGRIRFIRLGTAVFDSTIVHSRDPIAKRVSINTFFLKYTYKAAGAELMLLLLLPLLPSALITY